MRVCWCCVFEICAMCVVFCAFYAASLRACAGVTCAKCFVCGLFVRVHIKCVCVCVCVCVYCVQVVPVFCSVCVCCMHCVRVLCKLVWFVLHIF